MRIMTFDAGLFGIMLMGVNGGHFSAMTLGIGEGCMATQAKLSAAVDV